MTEIEFGQPLPRDLDYAVSFGIPTWSSALGYAEQKPEICGKMVTGYPRYYPQPPIQRLCDYFLQKYGRGSESCRPFPSYSLARDCVEYVSFFKGGKSNAHIEVETFKFDYEVDAEVKIAAVLASDDDFDIVKEYWKLRGECVSSRLATCLNQLREAEASGSNTVRQKLSSKISLAKIDGKTAKAIIKRRIVINHYQSFGLEKKNPHWKALAADPERDVHLVSSGMSSIFTVRRFLTFWEKNRIPGSEATRGPSEKSESMLCNTAVVFGFPFKDTQVIMRKLGNCKFYGFGDSRDIAGLTKFLESDGQRVLAVFVETPSNPLLNMPDLKSLRQLADRHGFALVVDDTIGGVNIDVMPYADIVCTSLTKLFSGSSNVMGGSIIINPKSTFHSSALEYFQSGDFEDLLWCEDAITLELNSRDYEERTLRCNQNTEYLLSKVLQPEVGKIFKKVYYPTLSSAETLANYDSVRNEAGGYGSLFSLEFYNEEDAETFYDSLKVFKGPSNGTNFTLACPYVHLAHHWELDDVSQFGIDPNLVRVNIGSEASHWLLDKFSNAIEQVRHRCLNRS
ncbi:hypothetical protein HG536_0A09580 [Torulaspora globosa]|uniref:Cystathionine gamma-synthase n=1 Tax=Torulaspora globosa TaxID=48254 RepID=A0A7G3ZCA5_9SACH|nr:uncharacterized protein HG536_0A09580 [Torulaspora globosa]QLL31141.1 hypothetical protein HG536_0A09580 [Torulaspora globosa]